MIRVVRPEESVANSILTSALEVYPNEAILLLRGELGKDEVLINDILIPPLATHGRGFSNFPRFMLPMDLSIIGVSHSHPSGTLRPLIHNLNHLYGRRMVITAYPFQSYSDIGVFNGNGGRLPHEVVPDDKQVGDDLSP